MEKKLIIACDCFLKYYHQDLNYIRNFKKFRENRIDSSLLLEYLNEFKVTRCLLKEKRAKAFELIQKFETGRDIKSAVNKLAVLLKDKKVTSRNCLPLSLSSKVLLLSNPDVIVPFDSLNSSVVGYTKRSYVEFYTKVQEYKKENTRQLKECLNFVKESALSIEKEFINEIPYLEKVRENRMLDKLLWTSGKKISRKKEK